MSPKADRLEGLIEGPQLVLGVHVTQCCRLCSCSTHSRLQCLFRLHRFGAICTSIDGIPLCRVQVERSKAPSLYARIPLHAHKWQAAG